MTRVVDFSLWSFHGDCKIHSENSNRFGLPVGLKDPAWSESFGYPIPSSYGSFFWVVIIGSLDHEKMPHFQTHLVTSYKSYPAAPDSKLRNNAMNVRDRPKKAYRNVCEMRQWKIDAVRCVTEWANDSWDPNDMKSMTWKNQCADKWINDWMNEWMTDWQLQTSYISFIIIYIYSQEIPMISALPRRTSHTWLAP